MLNGAIRPRPSGASALFGTRCHTIAEELIKFHLIQGRKGLDVNLSKLTDEERDVITPYIQYAASIMREAEDIGNDYEVSVERLVVIDPEYCFGTADLTLAEAVDAPAKKRKGSGPRIIEQLHVVDFKSGVDPVVAYGNTQLLTYGAGVPGCLEAENVRLTIVQPRTLEGDPISHWDLTRKEFAQASQDMRTLVSEAKYHLKIVDQYKARKDIPHPGLFEGSLKAGNHCKWCPAIAVCPKAKTASLEVAKLEFATTSVAAVEPVKSGPLKSNTLAPAGITMVQKVEPPAPGTLTDEQLGMVLQRSKLLDSWVKAVEANALERMLAGKRVPGFKLVAKRANRAWPENLTPKALAKKLKLTPDKVVTEPKLLTPAALEKVIGSKDKVRLKTLESLVNKPDAGVTLASESDRRPEISRDAALVFQKVPRSSNEETGEDE